MKTFTGTIDPYRKGLVNADNKEKAADLLGISLQEFGRNWQQAEFDCSKGVNKIWSKEVSKFGAKWAAI